jgi:hypothetical protein
MSNSTNANTSFLNESQVQILLITINLVLTFITTIITTTKFRAKCGCAECNVKPSNSAPSPPNFNSHPDV